MLSGAREQLPGLLVEGLDMAREQRSVYTAYSEDKNGVIALFGDVIEVLAPC